MKKYIYISLIAIISLTVAGCSINQESTKKDKGDTIARTVDQNAPESAEVVASTTDSNDNTISYTGKEGQTALRILQDKYQVEVEETSYGPMIKSINGVAADKDHFWAFYVNGRQATVGAGAYETKDSDQIEWRYEEVSF